MFSSVLVHYYMWVRPPCNADCALMDISLPSVQASVQDLPVPKHFLEAGHSVNDLKFSIIDHVPPMKRGGNREKVFWINKLET